jgi:GMP synthase (glutamine-hydrolysing)
VRALIFQHAEGEGPGFLDEELRARGVAVELRRSWAGDPVPPDPDGYDTVIVLGGPMAAWDPLPFLDAEARLLAVSARAGLPTLGVCLGAQLFARGLGARVFRGPAPELGLYPIALTEAGRSDPLVGFLDGSEVFQWHSDTFELPAGAVRLASSARYPNQAFAVGARGYGVQFHPECDRQTRRRWAEASPDELRAAGVAPDALDGDQQLDERGRRVARAFAALIR